MNIFTSTCNKSYDRHTYKITFGDGKEQLFGDYETMKNFWFTNCRLKEMVVSVTDPKKASEGFI